MDFTFNTTGCISYNVGIPVIFSFLTTVPSVNNRFSNFVCLIRVVTRVDSMHSICRRTS